MDRISKKQRSLNMSRIKSKGNNSTERALINLFKIFKLKGWRRHPLILGKPDFIFLNKKIIVFADGCFWHGCKCKTMPVHNKEFWSIKINKNIKRDKYVTNKLRKMGYHVFRIKECNIKKNKLPVKLINLYNNSCITTASN